MSAYHVYDWSRLQLVIFGLARVILIPALLMCAWPRDKPFFNGEGYPIFFSIGLGLTNGVIGSVPMIQAPSRVSEQHRELTGNIMTLSYNFGLTAGSLIAYVFEAMLGEPGIEPCGNAGNNLLLNSSLSGMTVAPPAIAVTFLESTGVYTSLAPTSPAMSSPIMNIINITSSIAPSFTTATLFGNTTF